MFIKSNLTFQETIGLVTLLVEHFKCVLILVLIKLVGIKKKLKKLNGFISFISKQVRNYKYKRRETIGKPHTVLSFEAVPAVSIHYKT